VSDTRIRRPTPERTAPIRDVRGAWGGEDPPARPPGDVAEQVVDSAYRVLDEHLRRGRDSARRWSPPVAPADEPPPGRRSAVDDVARMWADAAHAMFDVMAGVTRGAWTRGERPDEPRATVDEPPPRPEPAPARPPRPADPPAPAPAIAVVLHASVPVEVELDLRELPPAGVIAGDLLPQDDPSRPPLTTASVERVAGGVRLRLAVPAGHPPGAYAGTIHDAASGAASGVLRVVVRG
jgi:hypothetical protein